MDIMTGTILAVIIMCALASYYDQKYERDPFFRERVNRFIKEFID